MNQFEAALARGWRACDALWILAKDEGGREVMRGCSLADMNRIQVPQGGGMAGAELGSTFMQVELL